MAEAEAELEEEAEERERLERKRVLADRWRRAVAAEKARVQRELEKLVSKRDMTKPPVVAKMSVVKTFIRKACKGFTLRGTDLDSDDEVQEEVEVELEDVYRREVVERLLREQEALEAHEAEEMAARSERRRRSRRRRAVDRGEEDVEGGGQSSRTVAAQQKHARRSQDVRRGGVVLHKKIEVYGARKRASDSDSEHSDFDFS